MQHTANCDSLTRLLQALQQGTTFDHPIENFRVIETHISCILLTGQYAYKFKKPVNLGFLDFSTLQQRRFYCEEELRLNKRLAPHLYLAVVAITGNLEHPVLNGDGPVLEYAVKMVQFTETDQAVQLLQEGDLTERHIDQLAGQLAGFHERVAVAGPTSPYGTPEAVLRDAMDNFQVLRGVLSGDGICDQHLDELQNWTSNTYATLNAQFKDRKQQGHVRECHGDLHLGNIVLHEDEMLIFDCIEFSSELRWIDVMNDLAFLIMDLHERRRPVYAHRLLNEYLQHSGDYEGLGVLRFYLVYRALVRSKVAAIRLGQPHLAPRETDQEMRNEHGYLDLARELARPAMPALILTHGLSGSGKSYYSRALADKITAICIRSDVERKRLHGLRAKDRSHSSLRGGIYSSESTMRTFRRLACLSRMILQAGYSVIVDAAFLQKHTRKTFQKIASESHAAFLILDFQAEHSILQKRIRQRQTRVGEASEAGLEVLDFQTHTQEPLDEQECKLSLRLDTTTVIRVDSLIDAIQTRLSRSVAGKAPDLDAG